MEKFLVTIEFRYRDAPELYPEKVITIGVYDTFDDACNNGNFLMQTLESKYPLHKFPNGTEAKKERFSKYGAPFRTKLTLITDTAYLKTPFVFSAKITTLKFDDVEKTIDEIEAAVKRFKEHKSSEDDE